MDAEQSFMLFVLPELIDSDEKKTTRGKTKSGIERRTINGYFNNTIRQMTTEDCRGL